MPFCEPYKTDLIEEFCLTYEGLPLFPGRLVRMLSYGGSLPLYQGF